MLEAVAQGINPTCSAPRNQVCIFQNGLGQASHDNFYTSFCVPGLISLSRKLWPGACLASLQVHCLSTYLLVPRKQLKLLIQLHLWQFTQDQLPNSSWSWWPNVACGSCLQDSTTHWHQLL